MPAGHRVLCACCFRIRQLLFAISLSILGPPVHFIEGSLATPWYLPWTATRAALLFASSPRRTRSGRFVRRRCSDKGAPPG